MASGRRLTPPKPSGAATPVRVALAALWYGVIFLLSQSPGTDADSSYAALGWFALQDWNTLFRIAAHLGVFGIQGILIGRALLPPATVARVAAAILVTALLGLSDELHQAVMPQRHFRWFDVALDGLGGAAGCLALVGWNHTRNRYDRGGRPVTPRSSS